MYNPRANDYRQGAKRTAGSETASYEPLLLLKQQLQSHQQRNSSPQQALPASGYAASVTCNTSWTPTQQYNPPQFQNSSRGLSRGSDELANSSGYPKPKSVDKTHHSYLRKADSLLKNPKIGHTHRQDTNVLNRYNRGNSPVQGYRDKEQTSSYGSQDTDSGNEDSQNDSKRRCSNTYYNETSNRQSHLGCNSYDEKQSRGKSLSRDTILGLLTQTLDFLEDRNQDSLLFSHVSLEEGQFLYNLNNSKRLLKKLTSECSPLYMHVLQEVALNKNVFLWKINWRKVNGRKVPEYRKKYFTEKQLSDRDLRDGGHISRSFLFKYLTKILDFLEGSDQSSLVFSEVTDDRQLNFLHNLNSMKTSRFKQQMDPACLDIYLRIQRVKEQKRHAFAWQVLWSKRDSQKVLVYRKVPPDEGMEPDNGKKRRRDRALAWTWKKEAQWEAPQGDQNQRSGKDPADSIVFLPQREKEDEPGGGEPSSALWGEARAAEGEPRAPEEELRTPARQRVNRDKAMILEGLAKPVVATKAERMMQLMGWAGGALGSKGDGIVEPLAPNILQESRAGLGHVRYDNPKSTPRFGYVRDDHPKSTPRVTRRQRNNRNRVDDFEIGVWEPVVPAGKKSKEKRAQPPGGKRIGVIQRNLIRFKTEVLQKILEFVSDDRELELSFPVDLSSNYRRVVHCIVECIEQGKDMDYDTTHHMELVRRIEQQKDCVLYTESSGDGKVRERKLVVFKTAPDNTYIITPNDLEPDIVQPSKFIDESDSDCIVLDDSDDLEQISEIEVTKNMNGPTDTAKLLNGLTVNKSTSSECENISNKDLEEGEISTQLKDGPKTIVDETNSSLTEKERQKANNVKDINDALRTEESMDSHSSETHFVSYKETTGVNILGRAEMEGKSVDACPKNSACCKYMLCRKFVPAEQRSEFRKWYVIANYFAEDESDSEGETKAKIPESRVKKPRRRSVAERLELDLIANRMKTIGLPKPVGSKDQIDAGSSKHHRITSLLVKYLWEFFEDENSAKLRFLGNFKTVDWVIITTFMNDLMAIPDNGIEYLRTVFDQDEESFMTLKKIFEYPHVKIVAECKDNNDTSFVVYKVKTKDA